MFGGPDAGLMNWWTGDFMYVNKGASVYGHAVSIYPSVDFGNSINISILVDNGYQLAVTR